MTSLGTQPDSVNNVRHIDTAMDHLFFVITWTFFVVLYVLEQCRCNMYTLLGLVFDELSLL